MCYLGPSNAKRQSTTLRIWFFSWIALKWSSKQSTDLGPLPCLSTVKVINSVLRDRAGRRKSHVTWLSNWGTRLVFICPHGESLDTRRTPVTHSKEKNNNRRRTKDRKRRKKYIITSGWNRIHKEMHQPEQRNGNLDASTLSETWHLK